MENNRHRRKARRRSCQSKCRLGGWSSGDGALTLRGTSGPPTQTSPARPSPVQPWVLHNAASKQTSGTTTAHPCPPRRGSSKRTWFKGTRSPPLEQSSVQLKSQKCKPTHYDPTALLPARTDIVFAMKSLDAEGPAQMPWCLCPKHWHPF